MRTRAVTFNAPHELAVTELTLTAPADGDVMVDVALSGVSAGTERLLWSGEMPFFPGLAYPLVPGYEAVGEVTSPGALKGRIVFVPGANCYEGARGLFGATAERLVVAAERVVTLPEKLCGTAAGTDEAPVEGVLLALTATAQHAIAPLLTDNNEAGLSADTAVLIIGHGALGQLLARLLIAHGRPNVVVSETAQTRREGEAAYAVHAPEAAAIAERTFATIIDVSGDANIIDWAVARLAPRGEIVLAGFYAERLGFAFPLAFMREARVRIAAQWQPADMAAVLARLDDDTLSLSGIVSHRAPIRAADAAYTTAFTDPACLKMVLDWRSSQ